MTQTRKTDPAARLWQAQDALQHGRTAEAEGLYQMLLTEDPACLEALYGLGVVRDTQGRPAEAISLLNEARQRDPRPPILNRLGNIYAKQGQWPEAEACYRDSLIGCPSPNAEAYNGLGYVLREQGDRAGALHAFQKAVETDPQRIDLLNNLGNLAAELEDWPLAEQTFQTALSLAEHPVSAQGLVTVYNARQQWGEAVHWAEVARRLAPHDMNLCRLLADLYMKVKRPEAAVEMLEGLRAEGHSPDWMAFALGLAYQAARDLDAAHAALLRGLAERPNWVEVLVTLGNVSIERLDYEGGIRWFEQALALNPQYHAALIGNGVAHYKLGRPDRALVFYERALRIQPDAVNTHYNRALALLKLQRYDAGWQAYEWRLQLPDHYTRSGHREEWLGQPLAGKTLLVATEQGIGDAIQFMRYVPLLKAQGARIIVDCKPAIADWLRQCPWVDEVILRGSPECRNTRYDFYTFLLSLPAKCEAWTTQLPPCRDLLPVSAEKQRHWAERLPPAEGRLRVGLVWATSSTSPSAKLRSGALAALAPVLRQYPAQYLSLQPGARNELLDTLGDLPDVHALGEQFENFHDTAAVVQQLDRVITIDTATLHVAGTLGIPTACLLPLDADWRWGIHQQDTPWYPSVRLYRQRQPGDWASAVERLALVLAEGWLRPQPPSTPGADD